jgi:hypothetical protein
LTDKVNGICLNNVEHSDAARNHQRLANFHSVDAGNDVDGICAENHQRCHVDVVERANVQISGSAQEMDKFGYEFGQENGCWIF